MVEAVYFLFFIHYVLYGVLNVLVYDIFERLVFLNCYTIVNLKIKRFCSFFGCL